MPLRCSSSLRIFSWLSSCLRPGCAAVAAHALFRVLGFPSRASFNFALLRIVSGPCRLTPILVVVLPVTAPITIAIPIAARTAIVPTAPLPWRIGVPVLPAAVVVALFARHGCTKGGSWDCSACEAGFARLSHIKASSMMLEPKWLRTSGRKVQGATFQKSPPPKVQNNFTRFRGA